MRRVIFVMAALFAGVAALVIFVRLLERVSVYFPEPATDADRATLFGRGAEEVWMMTADGVRLNAVFAPSASDPPKGRASPNTADNGTSEPTHRVPLVVLYFHGNAGHLYHRADKARIFQDLGAAVFIVDYRGYGRSAGKPSEHGLYADAEAAYRYLTVERKVSAGRIVAFGESLGGAAAIYLASRAPLAGVICEGCFTSAADMARTLIPLLPYELILTQQFRLLKEVRKVRAPILFLHARRDEVVPFTQATRLYETAKAVAPAKFTALDGGHNDAYIIDADRYRDALRSFLATLATAGDPLQDHI